MSICTSGIMKYKKSSDMRNVHHKIKELIADYFVLGSYYTGLTERLLTGTHLVTIISQNLCLNWMTISCVLNRTIMANPPAKLVFKIVF